MRSKQKPRNHAGLRALGLMNDIQSGEKCIFESIGRGFTLQIAHISVKVQKSAPEELSQVALKQIEDREYDTEMLSKGVTRFFKFGIAFSGKDVKITV